MLVSGMSMNSVTGTDMDLDWHSDSGIGICLGMDSGIDIDSGMESWLEMDPDIGKGLDIDMGSGLGKDMGLDKAQTWEWHW